MKIPELNVPAGNFEKLVFAVQYGADAVYIGGKKYGLREKADNFTLDEIKKAVKYTHSNNVKLYVTVNIFAKPSDFEGLKEYLEYLYNINVDAVIVSDPGIIHFINKYVPKLNFFISTQSNNLNQYTAEFWKDSGASRIILARELSLDEIKFIKSQCPFIEFEMFGHGAVCLSYSGRCYLSKYMINRDANQGKCAHPCRWKYYLMEEKRPGEFFPVFEDNNGTHIMNVKDLCSIDLIPQIIDSGIDSIKIEGRMKSLYYVSAVTAVYKKALLDFVNNKELYHKNIDFYKNELYKISHRHYHSGFLKGSEPDIQDYNFQDSSYHRTYDFVGIIKSQISENHYIVEVRNKICVNDNLEVLNKKIDNYNLNINRMFDMDNNEILDANPNNEIIIFSDKPLQKYDILRKQK